MCRRRRRRNYGSESQRGTQKHPNGCNTERYEGIEPYHEDGTYFPSDSAQFPRGFSSVRLIPQKFPLFPRDLVPYSPNALFPRGLSFYFPNALISKDSTPTFPGDLTPYFPSAPYFLGDLNRYFPRLSAPYFPMYSALFPI